MRSAVVVVCSLWSMELEDLPSPVLVEILSRLGDSTELARCRLASRTLRSLSRDVRSVRLFCSRDRFLRSRAPDTCDHDTPFRSLVANLASFLSASPGPLALALAAERPLSAPADEVDDADDLHLTAVPFLARWLPLLAARLRSLAIDDYWLQSCWRPSQALSLIADICELYRFPPLNPHPLILSFLVLFLEITLIMNAILCTLEKLHALIAC